MQRTLLVLASILIISPLYSQGYRVRAATMQRPYDPAQETTMTGIVTEVLHPTMGRRMTGTHVMLKVGSGPVEVHLGPSFFLESKKFTVAPGDTLTLTGSKSSDGGSAYIIAREVTKGSQSLILRDRAGIPSWSRRGSGR